MQTDTSIKTFLQIVEDIEEPCEHSQHESKPECHGGGGQWYITTSECVCGRPTSTILVCDKFFQGSIQTGVHCSSCGVDKTFWEAYCSVRKKGQ